MSADAVRQKPIRQVELPLRRWLLKSMSETAFWRLKPDVPPSANSLHRLVVGKRTFVAAAQRFRPVPTHLGN
jgi:hypothetical protein